jgi:hypothetical protein
MVLEAGRVESNVYGCAFERRSREKAWSNETHACVYPPRRRTVNERYGWTCRAAAGLVNSSSRRVQS